MTNPKSPDNGQNRRLRDDRSASAAYQRLAPGLQGAGLQADVSEANGAQALDDIAAFIRHYLICSDDQLTILTLWIACTYCHHHFFTTPYLHVRSPQPQCGKSRCLNLLCDLSDGGLRFTGAPAAVVLDRLLQGRSLDADAPFDPYPVLIDDYHHSFGPSERQPLISFLNSGADAAGCFAWGDEDYNLFSPKAFAGNSPLPQSLASRCIPIHLQRPKSAEKFVRYWSDDVRDEAKPLTARLRQWLQQVSSALAEAAMTFPPGLPPALSPGQSQCAEPLVLIADVAGGTWPAKIRAALVGAFNLPDAAAELQMLFDLRAIFRDKNDPEYLATSDLLAQLRTLDSRPWSAWSTRSGQRLAGLLRPFGIISHRFHIDSENDFMGYLLEDFHDAWERYLPSSSASIEPQPIKVAAVTNAAHAKIAVSAIGAD